MKLNLKQIRELCAKHAERYDMNGYDAETFITTSNVYGTCWYGIYEKNTSRFVHLKFELFDVIFDVKEDKSYWFFNQDLTKKLVLETIFLNLNLVKCGMN